MTKQRAYFRVTGFGSPDAITSAIGAHPSRCHSDTDINPQTGRAWGGMEWVLDSGEPPEASIQQHVDSLLSWLSRRPSAVRALSDDYDLLIQCGCHATDTFGLHLTRDQTRQLGRLGIAFDYDGYVCNENDGTRVNPPAAEA